MFEIYKYEYDCGFITKQELQSYVPNYDLSQDEYNQIVGEDYVTSQTQSNQPSVPQA